MHGLIRQALADMSASSGIFTLGSDGGSASTSKDAKGQEKDRQCKYCLRWKIQHDLDWTRKGIGCECRPCANYTSYCHRGPKKAELLKDLEDDKSGRKLAKYVEDVIEHDVGVNQAGRHCKKARVEAKRRSVQESKLLKPNFWPQDVLERQPHNQKIFKYDVKYHFHGGKRYKGIWVSTSVPPVDGVFIMSDIEQKIVDQSIDEIQANSRQAADDAYNSMSGTLQTDVKRKKQSNGEYALSVSNRKTTKERESDSEDDPIGQLWGKDEDTSSDDDKTDETSTEEGEEHAAKQKKKKKKRKGPAKAPAKKKTKKDKDKAKQETATLDDPPPQPKLKEPKTYNPGEALDYKARQQQQGAQKTGQKMLVDCNQMIEILSDDELCEGASFSKHQQVCEKVPKRREDTYET